MKRVLAAIGAVMILAAVALCAAAAVQGGPRASARRFEARRLPQPDRGRITLRSGSVDANSDDPDELSRLSGIGPAYAQRIIDERLANGPYHYPEDLLAVRGIAERTLAAIRDQLFFPED